MALGLKLTSAGAENKAASALPAFLAKQSATQAMKTLGGIFLLLLLLIAALVYHDNRESLHGTAYVSASGEMRMLSQRLAKASSLALQGKTAAFAQLKESRDNFSQLLEKLKSGGEITGVNVPASPAAVQPQLDALNERWMATDKDTLAVSSQEKNLVELGKNVALIEQKNGDLLALTEQIVSQKLQAGSSARELVGANQLVMLTQRIAKNAAALLVGDEISPEVAFLLAKDTNAFRDQVQEVSKTSNDAETREKLKNLEVAFKVYQDATSSILSSIQPLVLAKQAGSRIFRDSDELLKASDDLAAAYQSELAERAIYVVLLIIMALMAIGVLYLLVRIYLDDAQKRAEAMDNERHVTEQLNRENQYDILRLFNEICEVSDCYL
jgi:twitching motility protein PilJ